MIVAPSILSADFARIAEQLAAVERGGADWIHLDVMDGHFVPNISWGAKIISDLRPLTPLRFDVHLMIEEPERYVAEFRRAGGDHLTFHYEATPHAHRLLHHVRDLGATAGLALNPGTPVVMASDLASDLDLLLVMTVNPGFGGQPFIESMLPKVTEARALLDARNPRAHLQVDGGVGPGNARACVLAGADVLVAGSSVFAAADPAEAVRAVRAAAEHGR